ncbi:putative tetratricopeptide-like helical domain superfamily, pre-mRNA-processing factor 6/Prp1/STA1 [Helianthus annuus]|nr:putative tetratricopeptide-like helical domain superfamily, pre-mRNA-processing factor 6/Prp1/STA1 [Helianthus annuus]
MAWKCNALEILHGSSSSSFAELFVYCYNLEEDAGKILRARELIRKSCEECPTNEDVWIEACRLVNPDDAKGVIARGVKAIPDSVQLWIQAARLEHGAANKSRVLRMGLEKIPAFCERAVECCPLHVELWLALARLEKYDGARKLLNKARKKLPKERAIWIAVAKLEEAFGNTFTVGKIIERGIGALQREGYPVNFK